MQVPGQSYGAQHAAAASQQRALGSVMNAADTMANIYRQISDQRASDEYATLTTRWNEWSSALLRDIEANPRMVDPEETGESYFNNWQALVRSRDSFLEEIGPQIRSKKARERFSMYAEAQFVGLEDVVRRFDIRKNRELLEHNFTRNAAEAVSLGDLGLLQDLADEYLANGTLSPVAYNEALFKGYEQIAKRNALMTARSMGYSEGIQWLSNQEHLGWVTHTGEQRTLTVGDQEAMIAQLRRERNEARSEEHFERSEQDRMGNEQAQRLFRNHHLSFGWIQNPENGLSWQSREHWQRMLEQYHARMADIAENGDSDGDQFSLEDLYRRASRGDDPISLDEAALQAFSAGSISEANYRTFVNWNKSNNPFTVLEDAYRYIDDVAKAQKLDALEVGQLRREFRERMIRNRFIQEGPDGWELNPDRLDQRQLMQAVRNIVDPYVAPDVLHANHFAFGERGIPGFYRPNSAEDFLRAIDDGRLLLVEDLYRDQLNQLEAGHARMFTQLFGRRPDAQIRDQKSGKTYYEYDGLTFKFQWNPQANDEQIMVWDGRRADWEPVALSDLQSDDGRVNQALQTAWANREAMERSFPGHTSRVPGLPQESTPDARQAAGVALQQWIDATHPTARDHSLTRQVARIAEEYGLDPTEVRRIYDGLIGRQRRR